MTEFDPSNINLQTVDPKDVICYFTEMSRSSYDSTDLEQPARVSSVIVIFFVSTFAAFFPVVTLRFQRLRIPLYLFLMARYFGAGVIIGTAFIHLLDPAFSEIGPQTCVGMTGAWANYSWPPAIAMISAMAMFLLDFIIESHVRTKLGSKIDVYGDVEGIVTTTITMKHHQPQHQAQQQQQQQDGNDETSQQEISILNRRLNDDEKSEQDDPPFQRSRQKDETLKSLVPSQHSSSVSPNSPDQVPQNYSIDGTCLNHGDNNEGKESESSFVAAPVPSTLYMESTDRNQEMITSATTSTALAPPSVTVDKAENQSTCFVSSITTCENMNSFEEQFTAFLFLELAVIIHSALIGLNLGVSGTEFRTLYPVVVFHQCFEGLGIGARLSTIPFPPRYLRWRIPTLLCLAFALSTPMAVGIGLLVRSSYSPYSLSDDIITGVLDSISAGILLYTGFVELLARDFLLHPERLRDKQRVSFMIICLYLGMAVMGVLGKWS